MQLFTEIEHLFLGIQLYTDSVQSCVWPDFDRNMTFCWIGMVFLATLYSNTFIRDNCRNQLRSGPAYNNTSLTKYSVYPGQCINLQQLLQCMMIGTMILQIDKSSRLLPKQCKLNPKNRCSISVKSCALRTNF